MSDSTAYDPYEMHPEAIREPPDSLWGALRKIGPGIILAGSIVGSGELLLTTSLGAKWGYIFLWLILFSCVIKVFVQIELGRYAISSGKPTLAGLNDLPGPRWRVHWQVWWWLIMLLMTVSQLGAMVGGVGQALHLAFPTVSPRLVASLGSSTWVGGQIGAHPEYPWAAMTALAAVALLLTGGYKSIERITTALVAGVTLITVMCVVVLPATGYEFRTEDFIQGFSFLMPAAGVAAAFSCFGITGVGASELYSYPYWCLEKGYAAYAGRRDDSEDWARRARGWMRVLHLDAWVSMVVFTVATVAFYILGATVLYRQGLVPEKDQMIATLAEMYVPTFGASTKIVFLIGCWAVLFKTLYVASAGHSRLVADFFGLARFVQYSNAYARNRMIRWLCVFFPMFALFLFLVFRDPRAMVVFGGFFQAVTLPIISAAAVYLRYKRTDKRLAPSMLSDVCLWFALVSITAVATYATADWFVKDLTKLFGKPPAAAGPAEPSKDSQDPPAAK